MKTNGYSLTHDIIINPEVGEYQAYGIKYTSGDEIIHISDISLCKGKLENLIDKLNRLQLMPVHIFDVVEDVLGQ